MGSADKRGAIATTPIIQQTFSTAGANAAAANRPSACSVAEVIAARHTNTKYGSIAADRPAKSKTRGLFLTIHAQMPIAASPTTTAAANTPASHSDVATNSRQAFRRSRSSD